MYGDDGPCRLAAVFNDAYRRVVRDWRQPAAGASRTRPAWGGTAGQWGARSLGSTTSGGLAIRHKQREAIHQAPLISAACKRLCNDFFVLMISVLLYLARPRGCDTLVIHW